MRDSRDFRPKSAWYTPAREATLCTPAHTARRAAPRRHHVACRSGRPAAAGTGVDAVPTGSRSSPPPMAIVASARSVRRRRNSPPPSTPSCRASAAACSSTARWSNARIGTPTRCATPPPPPTSRRRWFAASGTSRPREGATATTTSATTTTGAATAATGATTTSATTQTRGPATARRSPRIWCCGSGCRSSAPSRRWPGPPNSPPCAANCRSTPMIPAAAATARAS